MISACLRKPRRLLVESQRQQTGIVVSGDTWFGIILDKDSYVPVNLVFLIPVDELRPVVVRNTVIGVLVLFSVESICFWN